MSSVAVFDWGTPPDHPNDHARKVTDAPYRLPQNCDTAGTPLLASCSAQAGPGQLESEGWEVLFDGRSLDGWEQRGNARWVVEDGYATAVPGTGDGFLTTTRDFADYRIVVDFWADATANGGVYLRVPATGPGVNPSYEVNIMDSHADWPTGSINTVDRNDNPNTVGRWNTFDITMRGNRVTVLLNGTQVADGEAQRPASGRIALQKLERASSATATCGSCRSEGRRYREYPTFPRKREPSRCTEQLGPSPARGRRNRGGGRVTYSSGGAGICTPPCGTCLRAVQSIAFTRKVRSPW